MFRVIKLVPHVNDNNKYNINKNISLNKPFLILFIKPHYKVSSVRYALSVFQVVNVIPNSK